MALRPAMRDSEPAMHVFQKATVSLPHPGPRPPAAGGGWRLSHLWWAPHRLAFAAAALLLVLSALWWLGVQLARAGVIAVWPQAFDPGLLHGTLMTYGFMPLFFAGFLFTAGPKWLDMPAPSAQDVTPAVLLQGLGWLLWLGAAVGGTPLALAGAGTAALGLAWSATLFGRLLWRSPAPDRQHATLVWLAACVGVCALLGLGLAVAAGRHDLARACLLTGLWGFVATTFVVVAHRMIPFFTASALPMVSVWRPHWVLALMLFALGMKALSVWTAWAGWTSGSWALAHGFWMLVSGLLLLWLAVVWGLMQSLRIKLLAMLHLGFVWLGLGLLIDGFSHLWAALTGGQALYLGALHATTMGFLGSLMLAMVTRVSCGHSGRPLVADGLIWALFCLLQIATLLRLAAAVGGSGSVILTVAAATAWALTVVPWSWHLARWWGRPRRDGRPG
jgi:uncharacterized protein involved in response to NO